MLAQSSAHRAGDEQWHEVADLGFVVPVRLADDLLAVPVPGHTRGSTALLASETYLFTGDHLWWDEEHQHRTFAAGAADGGFGRPLHHPAASGDESIRAYGPGLAWAWRAEGSAQR